jgi:hypothetical protein
MYLSRCYYGNISEYFTWGGLDHQEIRTILGTPDYRVPAERNLFAPNVFLMVDPGGGIGVGRRFLPSESVFYNGDDLSENAYRMARHTVAAPVRIRFGHGEVIESVSIARNIPKRFRLAHLVATNCCNAIVDPLNQGHQITNWKLVAGEAAAVQ